MTTVSQSCFPGLPVPYVWVIQIQLITELTVLLLGFLGCLLSYFFPHLYYTESEMQYFVPSQ